jgi:hypothetical protein
MISQSSYFVIPKPINPVFLAQVAWPFGQAYFRSWWYLPYASLYFTQPARWSGLAADRPLRWFQVVFRHARSSTDFAAN